MTEVVGLFPDRMAAEAALDRLHESGYDEGTIGFADRHRDETGQVVSDDILIEDPYETARTGDSPIDDSYDRTEDAGSEAAKGAAGGAIGGAAVGAGAGILASAGLLLVPGIGPFLAAGTLAGTLGATAAGAAGGAVVGGAAGAIFGAADGDETASYYREGVDRGGALVTVQAADEDRVEVAAILERSGAQRVDVHSDRGWMD